MLRKFAKIILPPHSFRRRLAVSFARRMSLLPTPPPDIHYAEWIERTEPFLWTDPKEANITYKPLISIIVPVFNAPAKYLLPMVYSVVNQESYDNWGLILVNASTAKKSIRLTNECQQIDERIRTVSLDANKGIGHNTNIGIKNSTGEYIALLDHDDVLAPRALYEVAVALQERDRPSVIYSDEDKLTENGEYRFDVHFKPDWSPQLFRQVNFLNHLMVIEKKLINEVGGYRDGFEGAQDYDLFLRLTDKKPVIKHIPKILYHWRAAGTSTASDIATKKHVLQAGERALKEHMVRNSQEGNTVAIKEQPGFYDNIYKTDPKIRATVLLMPTNNLNQYTYFANHVLESLASVKLNTQLIVGPLAKDLNNMNKKVNLVHLNTQDWHEYLKEGTARSKTDVIVVFSAAVIPTDKSWLEDLTGLVTQVNTIGIAAPFIVQPKPSNKIFDAGFVKLSDLEIAIFKGVDFNKHTYFGNTMWSRNVDYLSGRVCIMRRSIFEEYFSTAPFYSSNRIINREPYDKLQTDGYEIATYSRVKMEYRGELISPLFNSKYLGKSLAPKTHELGLAKSINVPPEVG